MAVLLDGLPDESRSKVPRGESPWGWIEELLAQIVEELSVQTAQKAREEPFEVPRPARIAAARKAAQEAAARRKREESQPTVNADGSIKVYGHKQMLEFMRNRGAS